MRSIHQNATYSRKDLSIMLYRKEESEFLGVYSGSYEMYEDLENLDAKFRKIAPRILKLRPRDVKKAGVSKQTLWNAKEKIRLNQIRTISNPIKIKLLNFGFNC